ncbi:GNAT family N-acetyltransferase [Cupriavidus basilensis]
MRGISIRAAVTGQAPQIISILEQCGLDASALNLFATTFHIAVTESLIVGCAGVERHGDTAIIGPVAVLADYRDRGIASSLVQAALMRARAGGCRQAVMLAMRFATYFSRHGFYLDAAPRATGRGTSVTGISMAGQSVRCLHEIRPDLRLTSRLTVTSATSRACYFVSGTRDGMGFGAWRFGLTAIHQRDRSDEVRHTHF